MCKELRVFKTSVAFEFKFQFPASSQATNLKTKGCEISAINIRLTDMQSGGLKEMKDKQDPVSLPSFCFL